MAIREDKPWTVPAGVTVRGAGAGTTILQMPGTAASVRLFQMDGAGAVLDGLTLTVNVAVTSPPFPSNTVASPTLTTVGNGTSSVHASFSGLACGCSIRRMESRWRLTSMLAVRILIR